MSQMCENGLSDAGKYIDSLDPDDPEYVRQLRRPVEVKEDVRRMEERQRVKRILQSRAFRDELEQLVDELQIGSSPSGPAPVATRLPINAIQTQPTLVGRGMGACIPIADIRDTDTADYDKGEKLFRCKLASLYRLIDLFGWSHGIDSYITGRISQDFEHFLIAPYGMMHHEVTASSLVKVDMRGDVLHSGNSRIGLGVNKIGFSLHAAVYATRPDIKCIIHVRCTSAVAVSALQCGLLPLCPEAMSVGDISYYEYSGVLMDAERRDRLRRALGPSNKVLVLRNFGIIIGGETIEEAFWLTRNVMAGIDKQLHSISVGLENLKLPSDEEKRNAYESARQPPAGEDDKKWRLGEQDFETLMKQLDNVGYRTGYLYREPQLEESRQPGSDVMVPPTTSSFIYSFDEDGGKESAQTAAKGKKGFKSDWLGQAKKELDETTDSVNLNTTKASKWAPEDTSTPIKPETQPASRKSAGDAKARQETFETTLDADRLHGGAGEPVATKHREQSNLVQNGEKQEPPSPQKSISSNDALQDDHEASTENTLERESSKKDKKKKGFHMPSFGPKKK